MAQFRYRDKVRACPLPGCHLLIKSGIFHQNNSKALIYLQIYNFFTQIKAQTVLFVISLGFCMFPP